jgi:hypothetical protein
MCTEFGTDTCIIFGTGTVPFLIHGGVSFLRHGTVSFLVHGMVSFSGHGESPAREKISSWVEADFSLFSSSLTMVIFDFSNFDAPE